MSVIICGNCIFQKRVATTSPVPQALLEPSHCPTKEWGLIPLPLNLHGLRIHTGHEPRDTRR